MQKYRQDLTYIYGEYSRSFKFLSLKLLSGALPTDNEDNSDDYANKNR